MEKVEREGLAYFIYDSKTNSNFPGTLVILDLG